MQNETFELTDKAISGDREALQSILISVEDMIYNLSLRMLGSPHDAESRCIYVLGIMFKADSKVCGEILGITPKWVCGIWKIA